MTETQPTDAAADGAEPAPVRRSPVERRILDAALLMRYETVLRPAERQWPAWRETQEEKARSALGQFERQSAGWPAGRLDIGMVALASALSYLDLRFPDLDWRGPHPGLAAWFADFDQRPSMRATVLKA